MAGYRFCRSDDIPLLVAAYNACWVPHFGPEQALSVEDFKRGIRELGFWSSSCMVAFDGEEPIGVLIGAKRDGDANCVHRLAVKPGWERRGHGRHLLTSLADKAAILGPARLVAEIPEEWAEMRAFFEKSAFVEEARYADLVLDDAAAPSPSDDPRAALVTPIGLDELIESGAFAAAGRRAWARSAASLRARPIEGLAIATDRIEAFVLFAAQTSDEGRELVAVGAADDAQGPLLLALLVGRIRPAGEPVTATMFSPHEARLLEATGLAFRPVRRTVGYVAANQR